MRLAAAAYIRLIPDAEADQVLVALKRLLAKGASVGERRVAEATWRRAIGL